MTSKSTFRHPWWETPWEGRGDPARCLDEWAIIDISNSIREKPNWKSKYKDQEIAGKWKEEIRNGFKDRSENIEEIIAYAFKELEWYEYLEHNFSGIEKNGFKVSIDDRIVYSDTAVSEDIKKKLNDAVEKFRNEEFSEEKGGLDYHPGSENQVVDLVHPSLYPLQYGVTPIFIDKEPEPEPWGRRHLSKPTVPRKLGIAKYDDIINQVKSGVEHCGQSKKYQWIPAKLRRDHPELPDYHIVSYINNLHPKKYTELYEVIAKVFNASLPALNLCLSRFQTKAHIRVPIPMYDWVDEEYVRRKEEILETGDEKAWDEHWRTKKNHLKNFPPVYERDPEVDYTFRLQKFPTVNVIFKLANIELTPDAPSYKGGQWHLEGTINEDIVATVIYYYDSENITESSLGFKGAFEEPGYEQYESEGVMKYYGLEEDSILSKVIGKVETKEDRLLVFPNWFQHQVSGFSLKDRTKPGHRKILCMFLCDPYNEMVVSSEQIPPQQKDWWEDGTDLEKFGLNKDTMEQVLALKKDEVWPVGLNEIKVVREDFMKDRRIDPDCETEFNRAFNLCEH